jgi:hypothetical protein
MAVSRAHEADIYAALSEANRQRLIELLAVIVSEQGLASGAHPGMSEAPST